MSSDATRRPEGSGPLPEQEPGEGLLQPDKTQGGQAGPGEEQGGRDGADERDESQSQHRTRDQDLGRDPPEDLLALGVRQGFRGHFHGVSSL